MKFTIEIETTLRGTTAKVDCDGRATGEQAVAAIRALVDRTAQLTRNSPERILEFVEHKVITLRDDLIVGNLNRPRPGKDYLKQ